MSGEAFKRNHVRSSALTATDDCVRGRTNREPADGVARAASQLPQRQFHWGTPPPAAAPRMRIFMVGLCRAFAWSRLLGFLARKDGAIRAETIIIRVHVSGDFHVEGDFLEIRFRPLHGSISKIAARGTQPAGLVRGTFIPRS